MSELTFLDVLEFVEECIRGRQLAINNVEYRLMFVNGEKQAQEKMHEHFLLSSEIFSAPDCLEFCIAEMLKANEDAKKSNLKDGSANGYSNALTYLKNFLSAPEKARSSYPEWVEVLKRRKIKSIEQD